MTDSISQAILDYSAEGERLSAIIGKVAKDVYMFRLGEAGPKGLDTIASGYLDSWEFDPAYTDAKSPGSSHPDQVSAKFYVSGSMGYYDYQTIAIPLSYFGVSENSNGVGYVPNWLEPETATRDKLRIATARLTRDRANRDAEKERQQLRDLMAKHPDVVNET